MDALTGHNHFGTLRCRLGSGTDHPIISYWKRLKLENLLLIILPRLCGIESVIRGMAVAFF